MRRNHVSRLLAAVAVVGIAAIGAITGPTGPSAGAAGPPIITSVKSILRTPGTGASIIWIGRPFNYELTIFNDSAPGDNLVDGAVASGTMPAGLTLTAVPSVIFRSAGAATTSVDCSQSTTVIIRCVLNNLPGGEFLKLTLPGIAGPTLDPNGTVKLTMVLDAPQDVSASAVDLVNNIDPYPILITATDLAVAAGGTGIVSVTARNAATLYTVSALTARISLPAGGVTVGTPPAGCVAVAVPPAGTVAWDCVTPGPIAASGNYVFNLGISAPLSTASTSTTMRASVTPIFDPASSVDNASSAISVGPTAANDTVNVAFGQAFNGSIAGNDVVASGANFVMTAGASNGTATLSSAGVLAYMPNSTFSGVDQVTYTVTNPNGMSATATVSIRVAPKAVADSATTAAGVAASGSVSGNDSFATGATFAMGQQTTQGAISITSVGGFVYTPNAGFSGVDSFTYTVTNPGGGVSTATVTISVTPTAANDSAFTTAGSPLSGSVAGNDVYATGATFAALLNPSHGTVTMASDGSYQYTPAAGFSGADTFTYRVTNPDGSNATATVTIAVRPLATNDTTYAPLNTKVTGSVVSNDVFAIGATFKVEQPPTNGTVVMTSAGGYTYTPVAGFTGADMFTYSVTNPDGSKAIATVSVNVATIPPPIAVDDSVVTDAQKAVTGALAANDTTAAGAVFLRTSAPLHGTVVFNADGTFTYTPNPAFSGVDTFTYSVTNPDGSAARATATIRVRPLAVDQRVAVAGPNVAGFINTGGFGADGAVCKATSAPLHGTLVVNPDCTYTYTPKPGFSGEEVVGFEIVNPDGSRSLATVVLTVKAILLPTTGPVGEVRPTAAIATSLVVLGVLLMLVGGGHRRRRRRLA
jgi:hypothetical protein